MGNKIPDNKINEFNSDPNSNSERNNSLYFDEISSYGKNKNKKKNNDNELNIEHNPLISQIKSDPFIDYEITKELGPLQIKRIGCRIQGTYRTKSNNFDDIMGKMKGLFPSTILLDNYPSTDMLFQLIYKNGMYNIGPARDKDDAFV